MLISLFFIAACDGVGIGPETLSQAVYKDCTYQDENMGLSYVLFDGESLNLASGEINTINSEPFFSIQLTNGEMVFQAARDIKLRVLFNRNFSTANYWDYIEQANTTQVTLDLNDDFVVFIGHQDRVWKLGLWQEMANDSIQFQSIELVKPLGLKTLDMAFESEWLDLLTGEVHQHDPSSVNEGHVRFHFYEGSSPHAFALGNADAGVELALVSGINFGGLNNQLISNSTFYQNWILGPWGNGTTLVVKINEVYFRLGLPVEDLNANENRIEFFYQEISLGQCF